MSDSVHCAPLHKQLRVYRQLMRVRTAVLALLLAIAAAAPSPCYAVPLLSSADLAVANTTSGPIRGIVGNEFRMWRGIPFAEPPTGALRWMPPVPKASWAPAFLEAFDTSQDCAQSSGFGGWSPPGPDEPQTSSEDCLYLNVWAPLPPSDPSTTFPVMFFIVGGDYDFDGAQNGAVDGEALAALHSAIVVVANSRLGVFGFLGAEELRALSPSGSTGNYGILDQRLALQWVQLNAAAFHGDPERVLIFGESSGAGCVTNHLVSKGSRGLFSRAAMQSGAFVSWESKPMIAAQAQFDALVNVSGCGSGPPPDAGRSSAGTRNTTGVVSCLQNMELSKLLTKAGSKKIPYGDSLDSSIWAPVVDGVELTDTPSQLLLDGQAAPVPMLLGSNRDEGFMCAAIQ